MSTPNPLNKLTDTERAEVVQIIESTRDAVYLPTETLQPLFAAWEKMFPGDNQKITCRACCAYVVSNLRMYVGKLPKVG